MQSSEANLTGAQSITTLIEYQGNMRSSLPDQAGVI